MFESVVVSPFKLTTGPPGGEVLDAATSPAGSTWLLTYAVNPPKPIPPPPGAPPGAEPEYTPQTYSPQLYEMTVGGAVALRHTFAEVAQTSELPTSFAFGADGAMWLTLPTGIERYAPGGDPTLYRVPGYPCRIVAGPVGVLYFTQVESNELGRITPTGEVTEVPLSGARTIYESPAGPHDLAVGPEGALYFTEEELGRIARLTPGGSLEEFVVDPPPGLPTGIAFRPEPRFITAGPEGNMWFTDPGTNAIGRVTPGGEITEYAIPPLSSRGGFTYDVPNAIVALAGGLLFSESNVKAIGFVDPNGQLAPAIKAAALASRPRARTSRRNRSRCRRASPRRAAGHASPRRAPARATSHCGGRRARVTASSMAAPEAARGSRPRSGARCDAMRRDAKSSTSWPASRRHCRADISSRAVTEPSKADRMLRSHGPHDGARRQRPLSVAAARDPATHRTGRLLRPLLERAHGGTRTAGRG